MKLYRRSLRNDGNQYAQFVIRGKKYQFCTGTSDKEEAMIRALLEKRRIKFNLARTPAAPGTVQQVIAVYLENSTHLKPRTVRAALRNLNTLLALSGLTVNSPLCALTRNVVAKLQRSMIGREGNANTILTSARSVFSKRVLGLCEGIDISGLEGFIKYPQMRAPKKQYTPPPRSLMAKLADDAEGLRETDPRAYAAFLLGFYCGLRAGETCQAEWAWVVQMEDKDGRLVPALKLPAELVKSKADRVVSIAPEVLEKLNAVRVPGLPHIVPGVTLSARKRAVYTRLSKWIGERLGRRQTNHELRKYFGAMMATKHGIYAAQKALGHSTPVLTSQTYAGLTHLSDAIQPLRPVPQA